jgi:hypothetical protein
MSIDTVRTAAFTRILVADFCFRSADPGSSHLAGRLVERQSSCLASDHRRGFSGSERLLELAGDDRFEASVSNDVAST